MKLVGTVSASWTNQSQDRNSALSYIQSIFGYPISITSVPSASSWVVSVDADSEPSAVTSTSLKNNLGLKLTSLGLSVSWI